MLAARIDRAVLADITEWAAQLDVLRARQRTLRARLQAIATGTLPLVYPTPEQPFRVPDPLVKRMHRDMKELRIRRENMKRLESECWNVVLRLRRLMDRAAFIAACSE